MACAHLTGAFEMGDPFSSRLQWWMTRRDPISPTQSRTCPSSCGLMPRRSSNNFEIGSTPPHLLLLPNES
jgi:hypothetical protein